VVVLEATSRAGGAIASPKIDGVLIERGPQSFTARSAHLIALLAELGLTERIVEAAPSARKRFIWWNGRLHPVPRALLDRRFLPRRALLRALAEPFLPGRVAADDESVFEFVARRFGPKIAERLADPFVAGVFGGDAARLEVGAAFPELARLAASHGSVVRGLLRERRPRPADGPRSLFTLRNGAEAIVRALANDLGDRLRLDHPVERIEPAPAGGWRIHTPRGPFEVAEVAVTVPPVQAARFLPAAARGLAEAPTAPLVAVHLAYRAADVPAADGFGWLAPSSTRRDVLGCLWVSSAFPGHAPGRALFRVMSGGARDPGTPTDAEAAVAHARRVLLEVQGIDATPTLADVTRATLPQYDRGHAARVARLRDAMPGVRFLGWGISGIGVEACVRAASTG
jgi:oxygen-dependent protoporphyrinogen oxidase